MADEFIDFGFGADIDASGGLVEEEDFGFFSHPAGDEEFLLVAAGEFAWCSLGEGGGFDLEAVDSFGDGVEFCCSVADSEGIGHGVHDGGKDVLVDAEVEEEALDAAVFGDIAEPGGHCGADASAENFGVVDDDGALGAGVDVEDGVKEFGASCADEASDTEDFAGVEVEGTVVELSWGGEVVDLEDGFG